MSLARSIIVTNIIETATTLGARVAELTFEVNATIPANAAAGTEVVANITTDPKSQTTEKVVTIPSTQEWFIIDVFINDKADVQIKSAAKVLKNQRTPLLETPPLTSLLVSKPSRPDVPPAPLYFEPLSRLSVNVVNIEPEGTGSAKNVKFYMKVLVVDWG
jgi:hypothetical protein